MNDTEKEMYEKIAMKRGTHKAAAACYEIHKREIGKLKEENERLKKDTPMFKITCTNCRKDELITDGFCNCCGEKQATKLFS